MADDVVKRLLIKLGISTTEFQSAVKEIKSQLDQLYQTEKAKSAERRASAQQDATAQKAQIDAAAKITAATLQQTTQIRQKVELNAKSLLQMKEELAQEKVRLDVKQAQLKVMASQGIVDGVALKTLEKEILQERVLLNLKQQQLRAASVGAGGARGETGILGGVLRSAASGLFGGGLVGSVASGALAGSFLGTGSEKIVEVLTEKIRELAKATLEATGPAGQLREQFEKLAKREGADPEEFLNRLRVATRGLVEDNTLLIKTANNFMQGPLKLEPEQIEKLTGMTVALARAQGKDATEAMDALSRAALTGYTRQLSWVLGLTRADTSVRNLGKGVTETARQQLQLSEIWDAMARKLAEVGTPMTTLKDLFSQVDMAEAAFAEDLAYGLTHSTAFAGGIESISKWLMKVTPQILDFARSVGEKLGEAYYTVSTMVTVLGRLYLEALHAYQALMKFIGIPVIDVTWKEAMAGLAMEFIVVGYQIEKTSTKLRMYAQMAYDIAGGDFKAATAAYEEAHTRLTKLDADLTQDILANVKFLTTPTEVDVGTAGTNKPKAETDLNVDERAKVALELAKLEAKIRFDSVVEELHLEEEAEKQKYERGLETLAQYLEKERLLKEREHGARLLEIEDERLKKLQALALEQPGTKDPRTGKIIGGMDPFVRKTKEQIINKEALEAVIKDNEEADKEDIARTEQLLTDKKSAYQVYQQDVIKLQKESLDTQQKLLEENFKNGLVTADDYIAKKRSLITQERDLLLAELDEQLADSEKSEKEKADITVKEIDVRVQAEKKLTELTQQQSEIRLQGVEAQYKRQHDFIVAQSEIAQQGKATGKPGEQVASLELDRELLDLDEAQAKLLTDNLGKVEAGSKQWYEIVKQLGAVNQEMSQLNEKIAAATDLARPLAGLFGEMGKIFGSSDIGKWFNNMSGAMKELATFSKFMAASGGIGGLAGSFKELIGKGPAIAKPQTEMEKFNAQVKTTGDKFAGSMDGTIKQIMELADKAHAGMNELSEKWTAQVTAASQRMATSVDLFTNAAVTAAARLGGVGSGGAGTATTPSAQVTASGQPLGTELSDLPGQIPQGVASTENPQAISNQLNQLPLQQTADEMKAFGDAVAKPKNTLDEFAAKMAGFIDKLTGWAQGIGAVAQSIIGAKSATGGVLGGGLAGFQFGAQFGPMGMAIGAAAGAILGGIFGSKQAEFQKDMADIKTHLQAIEDNLKNNTVSLGQSIQQLTNLRGSVANQLKGSGKGVMGILSPISGLSSKKNAQQLQQILATINTELTSLLAQQKALLDQLHEQLGILLEPTQYQDILNSLDQIIAKYQTFASAAAGNANEMANANQFLVASLQAYALTLSNEVRSANEQAIQDATKLLDMQQQMNQLTLQEYDILTQGVLTRQRPTAMTKGAQIEQVELQKQNLTVEENLQEIKVNAEKQMFSLAQDRLGLEKQMADLQTIDIDQQMAKIAAMEASLAKLNAALGPGGQIPAGLLTATGGVDLSALEQLLGLPPTAVGPAGAGQPFIQNIPPIYQEMIDVIDTKTQYKNFGTDLLAAASTPFRSPQRERLLQELRDPAVGKALVAAGVVAKPVAGVSQDPNWVSFFGWIDNIMTEINPGAAEPTVPTPTLPGLQTGGYVQETGAAVVHQGEVVLNSGQVGFSGVRRPIEDQIAAKLQIQAHQTIYDLATTRIGMEHDLLLKQGAQTTLDMQRISMLSELLQQWNSQNNSGSLIENQLSALYATRGRYGSASFRREIL